MIPNFPQRTYSIDELPPIVAEQVRKIPAGVGREELLQIYGDYLKREACLKKMVANVLPFSGDWVRGEGDWPEIVHTRFMGYYNTPKIGRIKFIEDDALKQAVREAHRSGDFRRFAASTVLRANQLKRADRAKYSDLCGIGAYVLSAEAADFFRTNAPNDFEIYPIEVSVDGERSDAPFFLMAATRVVDALNLQLSGLRWSRFVKSEPVEYGCSPIGPVYFDEERLGDAKLFMDVSLPGQLFISKEFFESLSSSNIFRPGGII